LRHSKYNLQKILSSGAQNNIANRKRRQLQLKQLPESCKKRCQMDCQTPFGRRM